MRRRPNSLSDLRTGIEHIAIFCENSVCFRNYMLEYSFLFEEYCENFLSPTGC